MKKIYLVKFDGYTGGYGSLISLLGIFDSEAKAKEAIENAAKEHPEIGRRATIEEVKLNKAYKILKDKWNGFSTEHILGGYIE